MNTHGRLTFKLYPWTCTPTIQMNTDIMFENAKGGGINSNTAMIETLFDMKGT